MLKIEKEYNELYGDVSEDSEERMQQLIENKNFSRTKKKLAIEIARIQSIKKKREEFIIYLLPKATPRPRAGKYGFYVKGAADNKRYFEKYIEGKDIPLITTPTTFYCNIYLPIPKTMDVVDQVLAELGYIYPISKPDWDNLAKAYCDMIQDTLICDDCIIIDGGCSKRYSTKPRIEITLEYLEDFDCNYNKHKIMLRSKKRKGG